MATEEERANERYRRKKARLLHKCYACGTEIHPAYDGSYHAYCPDCLGKRNGYTKARREKRLQEHRCVRCGASVAEVNPKTNRYFTRCQTCREYEHELQRKYWSKVKAQQKEVTK